MYQAGVLLTIGNIMFMLLLINAADGLSGRCMMNKHIQLVSVSAKPDKGGFIFYIENTNR